MNRIYRQFGKRAVDLVIAVPATIVLSPVILLLGLLIWMKMGRPVFFRQRRGGYRGNVFEVVKFRSMNDAVGENGEPLPDEKRLTRFGSLLRQLSLDELPQLWNVLNGTMSLVGPRPLLVEYLDRYSAEQARRHDVKPGITGWAQINGRNAVTWEEKFRLDVEYVDRQSLFFDLKILARTAVRLCRRDNVNAEGHATMPKFMGSKTH